MCGHPWCCSRAQGEAPAPHQAVCRGVRSGSSPATPILAGPGQQRRGPCSRTAHHQDGCTAFRNPVCPGRAGMGPTATPTTRASATTWLPLCPTGPGGVVAPQDQSHSAAGPQASLQLLACLLRPRPKTLCQVKAASGLQGPPCAVCPGWGPRLARQACPHPGTVPSTHAHVDTPGGCSGKWDPPPSVQQQPWPHPQPQQAEVTVGSTLLTTWARAATLTLRAAEEAPWGQKPSQGRRGGQAAPPGT